MIVTYIAPVLTHSLLVSWTLWRNSLSMTDQVAQNYRCSCRPSQSHWWESGRNPHYRPSCIRGIIKRGDICCEANGPLLTLNAINAALAERAKFFLNETGEYTIRQSSCSSTVSIIHRVTWRPFRILRCWTLLVTFKVRACIVGTAPLLIMTIATSTTRLYLFVGSTSLLTEKARLWIPAAPRRFTQRLTT